MPSTGRSVDGPPTDPHPRQGFHDSELTVQRRAGVSEQASRLSPMLGAPDLDGSMSRFLAGRDLIMITARDGHGDLWTSPIVGEPGFCVAHAAGLTLRAVPAEGDPLRDLRAGQPVGILAVDFDRRRRLRVNGVVTRRGPDHLEIAADQAYGNCPRYIQQRHLLRTPAGDDPPARRRGDGLQPDDIAQIARADTVVLGTIHPTSGADTSHRGGPPGFVRVRDGALWWPDYPGNNLFNSLGNIVAEPAAALLFLDVTAQRTLQVSGTATLGWAAPGGPGDDGGTGRRVRVAPARVVATTGSPFRGGDVVASPHNPVLS